jgi:hypothetical protein
MNEAIAAFSKFEAFTTQINRSVLLKDGFVVVVVTETPARPKVTEPPSPPSSEPMEPPGHFVDDYGWVDTSVPPNRLFVAFNETTGELVPMATFGRAWNFEHEPTVDEVLELYNFWTNDVGQKVPRHEVFDTIHDPPQLIPAPAIVDCVLTFVRHRFTSCRGNHYNDATIRLPKTEDDGLQF